MNPSINKICIKRHKSFYPTKFEMYMGFLAFSTILWIYELHIENIHDIVICINDIDYIYIQFHILQLD
jgi:hypothetical protein